MRLLSDVSRRWLGPALFFGFSLLSVSMFGHYLKSQQFDLDEMLEQSHRLESTLSAQKKLEASTGDFTREAEVFFHKGQTREVVAANLLTELNRLSAQQGIQIMRSATTTAESQDANAKVSVYVELAGTESAIYGFLQQIESSRPVVQVIKFRIRADILTGIVQVADSLLSAEITVSGATKIVLTE